MWAHRTHTQQLAQQRTAAQHTNIFAAIAAMLSTALATFCLALGALTTGATAQTIVDLAVATPSLSTLVTALTAADLVETLQSRCV